MRREKISIVWKDVEIIKVFCLRMSRYCIGIGRVIRFFFRSFDKIL